MSTKIKFELRESNALKGYREFYSKTQELLAGVKDRLKELPSEYKVGRVVDDEKIMEGYMGLRFKHDTFSIWIGLYQFDEHDEVQLNVSCDNVNKTDERFEAINRAFNKANWRNYCYRWRCCCFVQYTIFYKFIE